jgi:hypothetical protein
MTPEQFLLLQEELWKQFYFFAKWWLILFSFSGVALAVLMFFMSTVNSWLDSK